MENAYFKLYKEEDRFYLELELFGQIGLDDNRYEINMIHYLVTQNFIINK